MADTRFSVTRIEGTWIPTTSRTFFSTRPGAIARRCRRRLTSGFVVVGNRVTGFLTEAGATDVDHVVIVAGVDTPALLAHLGEMLMLIHPAASWRTARHIPS